MTATRFAVAAHILMLLAEGESTTRPGRSTSQELARSVNTNPVVVRRITGQLARAGLVRVRRGPGGAALARAPEEISLGEVWQAVNPGLAARLLPVHPHPDPSCPVGRRVPALLGAAERELQSALAQITLDRLMHGMQVDGLPASAPARTERRLAESHAAPA
ncbi:MAG TPA: Rrf2 family transcriptional regulator [Acetobacteraceae bacterium]|nr:Rrf2 family transcriptional regulator [Acetobacteraceae bacterium]